MADKPVINTISGGAVYSATRLNEIFDQLADAIEGTLGLNGVEGSPNSMSANLDMNTNEIINIGTPTTANAAATKAYADAVAANIDIDTATANDLLTSIKTVDGDGSGLDADLLDGYHASINTAPSTCAVRDANGRITANFIGEVKAPTGDTILDNGTDGTDATFIGDVTGDVTGDLTGNADTSTTATKHGVLNVKSIDIGDWNMSSVNNATVAHGLDHTKIRVVSAIIRNDDDSNRHVIPFGSTSGAAFDGSIDTIDSTNVILTRASGSRTASATFDSTSYNRGWITIWYVD